MEYPLGTRIIFIFFMLVITGSYWMKETEATGRRLSPFLPTHHEVITPPSSMFNQTNDEPKDCKKITTKCTVCCKYTVCDTPLEMLICIGCCPPGTPGVALP
ncbi:hypothetical protein C5167_031085 [Papaver somniferum]|uniref:uncharacterized protein LOC113334213 n=1 Tax=Papaver somniferum TaxID=3469 RepID=UPI000E701C82|nr:uncharacterized protein LOC113334213 [Papaver somniferum]RZC88710.1 hypothetical protein C5167_031085 [Papaver somniferum]